ncbi:hypothetical protein V8C35DRAFT_332441 [Trichoderma chlorosporum]
MTNRPSIDFFDESWQWPAYKFGLDMAALTGSLFDQFNTYDAPLQDFDAFFCDIRDISRQASTTDEFYALLKARKEQRQAELQESFRRVAMQLTGDPGLLPKGSWGDAVCFFRNGTLGAVVTFFARFLGDQGTRAVKGAVKGRAEGPEEDTATKEAGQGLTDEKDEGSKGDQGDSKTIKVSSSAAKVRESHLFWIFRKQRVSIHLYPSLQLPYSTFAAFPAFQQRD